MACIVPASAQSHKTPSSAPETWGTHCITELAPLFREAILLAQMNQFTSATDATSSNAPRKPSARNSKHQATHPVASRKPDAAGFKYSAAEAAAIAVGQTAGANRQDHRLRSAQDLSTMDPGWPEATAVAVKDGRILSVGTLKDLKPWLDRFPHEIDKHFQEPGDLSRLRRGARPSRDGIGRHQLHPPVLLPLEKSLWSPTSRV